MSESAEIVKKLRKEVEYDDEGGVLYGALEIRAAILIEEQAARIAELEQKLRTTSMEALAISDTNNELAAKVVELERQVSLVTAQFRYAAKSNTKNWDDLQACQARLSEAVKVLEEAIGQIAGDAVAIDGEWGSGRDRDELDKAGEMPDAYYMAKAFIATLGENRT